MPMSPRLLRPRATGFNPKSIANLGAWFDASDLSTLSQTSDGGTPVTANNQPVGYFKCKATGVPLIQTTDANRPLWKSASSIGSKPGLDFDGAGDNLAATSGELMNVARNVSGSTVFTVLLTRSSVTKAFWHYGIGNGTNQFRGRSSVAWTGGLQVSGRRLDADVISSANAGASSSTNVAYIMRSTFEYSNAILRLHLNGTSVATTNPFQTTGNTSDTASSYLMLGSQYLDDAFTSLASSLDGVVSEWLFYKRTLSSGEITLVERYLASKYGITVYAPPSYADADVNTYITAVENADGQALETGVRDAINTFITGCKADGIWPAIKASCILMGARTLSGALTPLVGAAPTNTNFVSGDYNRKTGLVGNGSTKYLDSNRNNNADPQNSHHIGLYVSSGGLPAMGAGAGTFGSSQFSSPTGLATTMRFLSRTSGSADVTFTSPLTGFVGKSRSVSNEFIARLQSTNTTGSLSSQSPYNGNIFVFARSPVGSYSSARIAFYSIGESLALASLDTRLSTLYTAIGAAIP